VLLVDELPPGGVIISEFDRGVTRSRFTVAVLSPAYLETSARRARCDELAAAT
jgi:hypothetical protein